MMHFIPCLHPHTIRDGDSWHEGHKHFEFEITSDGSMVVQTRHKNKYVQIFTKPDGTTTISRFYEVGGKYYNMGDFNVPKPPLATAHT